MATPKSNLIAPLGYRCFKCGARNQDWVRCCPVCCVAGAMRPERPTVIEAAKQAAAVQEGQEERVADIEYVPVPRISSGMLSIDYVLNGGLPVSGGYLVGGEPGAGKTTTLMQICGMAELKRPALYVSGEQNKGDLQALAHRLGVAKNPNLYILTGGVMEEALAAAVRRDAQLVVIDSIQTMTTTTLEKPAGHQTVTKYVINNLCKVLKDQGRILLVVGQVNKEGEFEGTKGMEHIVDGLWFFSGPRDNPNKTLGLLKHRYGPADRKARLKLTDRGMVETEEEIEADGPRKKRAKDDIGP